MEKVWEMLDTFMVTTKVVPQKTFPFEKVEIAVSSPLGEFLGQVCRVIALRSDEIMWRTSKASYFYI